MTDRYLRQTILPEVGEEGQERLRQSIVAIVGCGGLGSCAAELLCRAGVGRLILLDYDIVERSNLQRQALYEEADIGIPKATAAERHLKKINKESEITTITKQLNLTTLPLLDEAEIILDCTDNLQTRFLLNEYCMKRKVPFVYCGAVETRGMVYVVDPSSERACFNCIFDSLKSMENCEDFGVLNVTVHLAATLQVMEALKLILEKPYLSGLLSFDIWNTRYDTFAVKRKKECPVCAGKYGLLSGKEARIDFCQTKRCVKVRSSVAKEVDLEKIAQLPGVEITEEFENGIRAMLNGVEFLLFQDGFLEVRTRNQDRAKAVAKKILG